jgi:hypothetical protein
MELLVQYPWTVVPPKEQKHSDLSQVIVRRPEQVIARPSFLPAPARGRAGGITRMNQVVFAFQVSRRGAMVEEMI